jgi:predicted nucleic acid-binding protein
LKRKKRKYYIDTNIFLNIICDERPFVNGSLGLMEKIQEGGVLGITSSVTEMEIALDLERTGNRECIDRALRLIEGIENLTISPLGPLTAKIAVKLVLENQLTVHDAYHGATALENGAEVFVTRDKLLATKLGKFIKVLEPEAVRPD